jgi:hypothetical protein
MKILKNLLLILVLGSPLSAQAAYFLAAFGTAEVDEEGFKDDTASRFGIGFGSSEEFQFELSYLNLGEFEATDATLGAISSITDVNVTGAGIEITGMDLSVVGSMPLNDLISMRGRLGTYIWDSELTVSVDGSAIDSISDDGTDIGFGIGLAVALGTRAGLMFMYDQYEAFDTDIKLLNAGIKVDF